MFTSCRTCDEDSGLSLRRLSLYKEHNRFANLVKKLFEALASGNYSVGVQFGDVTAQLR